MKFLIGFALSIVFGFRALISLFPMTIEHYSNNILSIVGFLVLESFVIAFTWNTYRESAKATKRAIEENRVKKELKEERDKILSNLKGSELLATYLGGSGYNFNLNSSYHFIVIENIFKFISEKNEVISIDFKDIINFDVGGPGKTTTNAGVSGGGFGLEGFIKGAITATVINSITSSSSVNTFFKLLTKTGEVYFHTSACEPDKLKMVFSPLSVHIGNRNLNNGIGIADEILKLNTLLQNGAISKEEFNLAKNKIIG